MARRPLVSLLAVVLLTGAAVPPLTVSGPWGIVWLACAAAAVGLAVVFLSDGPGRSSAPIGILSGAALTVVVPALYVAATPDPPGDTWMAPLAFAVVAGVRLAWLVGAGMPRLVELMVWTFVYTFLGLAPMVQLRTGVDPDTTPHIVHAFDGRALAVVGVGIAAMGFGLLAGRVRTGERGDRPARPVAPRRVTTLAIAGLLGAGYFIVGIGPGALFGSRQQLALAAQARWPDATVVAVVAALAVMPLLVAFVALQVQRAQGTASGWLQRTVLPVATGLMLLLVANPVSSARYTAGTVYLAVLASMGLVATRPRFRTVALGFIAALLLVFPLADAFRYADSAVLKAGDPVSAMSTGDFDAFAQIVNTVHYVEVNGLDVGQQASVLPLFWVPRSVWPNKPVDTGSMVAEFRDYGFTNLSAPLWAELFINGGWLALVVGMLGFGVLIRRWDTAIVAALARSRVPGILSSILPFYLLILLRGSLLQATAALAVIVACSWFVRDRSTGADRHIEGRDLGIPGATGGARDFIAPETPPRR